MAEETLRGINLSLPVSLPSLLRRYLDPDPLLLASARGQEENTGNPRFHALNQAIVQLVSYYRHYTMHMFLSVSKSDRGPSSRVLPSS